MSFIYSYLYIFLLSISLNVYALPGEKSSKIPFPPKLETIQNALKEGMFTCAELTEKGDNYKNIEGVFQEMGCNGIPKRKEFCSCISNWDSGIDQDTSQYLSPKEMIQILDMDTNIDPLEAIAEIKNNIQSQATPDENQKEIEDFKAKKGFFIDKVFCSIDNLNDIQKERDKILTEYLLNALHSLDQPEDITELEEYRLKIDMLINQLGNMRDGGDKNLKKFMDRKIMDYLKGKKFEYGNKRALGAILDLMIRKTGSKKIRSEIVDLFIYGHPQYKEDEKMQEFLQEALSDGFSKSQFSRHFEKLVLNRATELIRDQRFTGKNLDQALSYKTVNSYANTLGAIISKKENKATWRRYQMIAKSKRRDEFTDYTIRAIAFSNKKEAKDILLNVKKNITIDLERDQKILNQKRADQRALREKENLTQAEVIKLKGLENDISEYERSMKSDRNLLFEVKEGIARHSETRHLNEAEIEDGKKAFGRYFGISRISYFDNKRKWGDIQTPEIVALLGDGEKANRDLVQRALKRALTSDKRWLGRKNRERLIGELKSLRENAKNDFIRNGAVRILLGIGDQETEKIEAKRLLEKRASEAKKEAAYNNLKYFEATSREQAEDLGKTIKTFRERNKKFTKDAFGVLLEAKDKAVKKFNKSKKGIALNLLQKKLDSSYNEESFFVTEKKSDPRTYLKYGFKPPPNLSGGTTYALSEAANPTIPKIPTTTVNSSRALIGQKLSTGSSTGKKSAVKSPSQKVERSTPSFSNSSETSFVPPDLSRAPIESLTTESQLKQEINKELNYLAELPGGAKVANQVDYNFSLGDLNPSSNSAAPVVSTPAPPPVTALPTTTSSTTSTPIRANTSSSSSLSSSKDLNTGSSGSRAASAILAPPVNLNRGSGGGSTVGSNLTLDSEGTNDGPSSGASSEIKGSEDSSGNSFFGFSIIKAGGDDYPEMESLTPSGPNSPIPSNFMDLPQSAQNNLLQSLKGYNPDQPFVIKTTDGKTLLISPKKKVEKKGPTTPPKPIFVKKPGPLLKTATRKSEDRLKGLYQKLKRLLEKERNNQARKL